MVQGHEGDPPSAISDRRGLLDRARTTLGQVGPVRLLSCAAALVLALAVARFSAATPLLEQAELALYDVRALIGAPLTAQDRRVVMVVFDKDTLHLTPVRSPLDRGVLAEALSRIDAMGAKAIGVDILVDRDQPQDAELMRVLRTLRTPTRFAFATSASNPDDILPAEEEHMRQFFRGLTGSQVAPANVGPPPVRQWPSQLKDLPPLMANALYPSGAQFRDYHGAILFRRSIDSNTPTFETIPIQMFVPQLLDLMGVKEPASQNAVLGALPAQIRGRYVLIGADLPNEDRFDIPYANVSGLELHAQMLTQMLEGRRLQPIPGQALWLAAALVVLAGAVTAISELPWWRLAPVFAIQLGALIGVPIWLQSNGWDTLDVPMLGWLLGWTVAFAAVGLAARSVGSQQRRFAQSALGRYLPRDVAGQILRDPQLLALHGERREIYAVFTDLQDFTALCHSEAPEVVAALLNRYLDQMSDVVLRFGGTIDKFVADALVAFWGAPISRPDDAERAAAAAVALHAAGETFRRSPLPGAPALGRTRVGLHKGEAVVGNFGGKGRIQYTALGDGMNTAARLEQANKQLNTAVLASRQAIAAVRLECLRPMGRIVLRGRRTPVEIWEAEPSFPAEARERLGSAYARFDAGVVEALAEIEDIAAAFPDDLALANFVLRLKKVGPGGSFVLQ